MMAACHVKRQLLKQCNLTARLGRFPRAAQCNGRLVCIRSRQDRVVSAADFHGAPNLSSGRRAARIRVPYSGKEGSDRR